MKIWEKIYKYTAMKAERYSAISLAALFMSLIPELSNALITGGLATPFGSITGSLGVGGGGIGESLCTIVSWFTVGGVGSAVASLAVIFLGIGAFFGKVTWGMALMFATGIFAIFGSSEIVSAITNGAGTGCF